MSDTSTVDAYSFEFNSLVSSYYTPDDKIRSGSREKISVGLVHSVLLAKHLGVERLRATRRYYDLHCLPKDPILRKAIKLLLMQTITCIAEGAAIRNAFDSFLHDIPIFLCRMQLMGLWTEEMNW